MWGHRMQDKRRERAPGGVHPVTFPDVPDGPEWHLTAPDEAFCWPTGRDVAVALVLGLLAALTVFAFFPWLPLVAHACVFGLVFAAVILFGRKVACRG